MVDIHAALVDEALLERLRQGAERLLANRRRRALIQGLERVLSPPPRRPSFSSAVTPNREAVEMARPALEQLAQALCSRDRVQGRGVVLTHQLLTDPCSALYHPAQPGELHEVARQAMLALAPDPAPPHGRERAGRSHGRAGSRLGAPRSRSPL
jgi:hypothetical protein